jgi:putative toxin-antitoxin system antitoxin component (TIGR02293 family)
MDKFDATITNIFNYAVEVFGNPALAREWMNTPLIALGGQTPLEFLSTEEGVREVEAILGQIENGDFS